MIGKTFTVTEKHITRTLRPIEEYFQYGRRFYGVEDSSCPGVLTAFIADDFDNRFKTSGKMNNRKCINSRYRRR